MAKEELIQFEGLVTEILPDARYRVQLDAGHEIVAYTAGKMKKNRIKTLAGDRVTIEMSPYDLEKGRLIFRHKDERPGGGAPRGAAPRGHFPRSEAIAKIAYGEIVTMRRRPRPVQNRARSKNRAPQHCFGPYFGIISFIDFRPDDISYPPVQPV